MRFVASLFNASSPRLLERVGLLLDFPFHGEAEIELARYHGLEEKLLDGAIDRCTRNRPASLIALAALAIAGVAPRPARVVVRTHPSTAAPADRDASE